MPCSGALLEDLLDDLGAFVHRPPGELTQGRGRLGNPGGLLADQPLAALLPGQAELGLDPARQRIFPQLQIRPASTCILHRRYELGLAWLLVSSRTDERLADHPVGSDINAEESGGHPGDDVLRLSESLGGGHGGRGPDALQVRRHACVT